MYPRHPSTKRAYFHSIIQRSLYDLYRKMERDLEPLPQHIDNESDEEADRVVRNVWAIEEEWIMDPELRDQLTLIQCRDEDDRQQHA